MELVVGRIGRAHGIRGDVAVEVRTDSPEERFTAGNVLRTEGGPPLSIEDARWHSGRLLVHFGGVRDRDAAERLSGLVLLTDVAETESTDDPEEFFDHQLVGLRAVDLGEVELGEVTEVLHLPAQDVLVVRTGGQGPGPPGGSDYGQDVLVPFVAELVPTVDPAGGRVVLDPPEGLF